MIELEAVTKKFGERTAVDALSLHIPRGEFFCFLGPNGAGKTTTIKLLCGLLRPTSGRLRVGGHDVREDAEAARRICGYVPDMPFLYDRLTASEFHRLIGDLYGVPLPRIRERREADFALFGLEEYGDTLVKDLSHGLRQRLIYTATFLHDPEVLFVDEPFVGLDPHSIRLINGMLRERTRAGVTVFMTTHILALVEDLADRVGIIHHGRLVALGSLEELRRQTRSDGRLEDIFLSLTEDVEAPAAAAH